METATLEITVQHKQPLLYLHTQYGWGIIALVVTVTTLVLALLLRAELYFLVLVVGVILTVVLMSFGALTVSVSSEELRLRFGIGLIRKRIPLSQIRSYQVVQNKWWYGWGIRITPHGTLWNVSGLGAVELLLDGPKKFRIGTDEPEALQRALERLAGKAKPSRPEDEAAAEGRAKRIWLIVVGFAVVSLVGIGGLLWAESRPPKSSVDAEGLHVSSAPYSADISLEAMTEVALLQRRLGSWHARTALHWGGLCAVTSEWTGSAMVSSFSKRGTHPTCWSRPTTAS